MIFSNWHAWNFYKKLFVETNRQLLGALCKIFVAASLGKP